MDQSTGNTKRYDEKLRHILIESAQLFAEKGFHHASMRDISRRTGISLAGLYYYFQNKDELLFLIIQNAFDTALEQLKASVDNHRGPDRVRFFIRNHLATFIDNLSVAKVVVHEADSLSPKHGAVIQEKQRGYLEFLHGILEEQESASRSIDSKLAALTLFGMMNWIYTWYDPTKSRSTEIIADTMAEIFLNGYLDAHRQ